MSAARFQLLILTQLVPDSMLITGGLFAVQNESPECALGRWCLAPDDVIDALHHASLAATTDGSCSLASRFDSE
jgi:hypothetical protein